MNTDFNSFMRFYADKWVTTSINFQFVETNTAAQ